MNRSRSPPRKKTTKKTTKTKPPPRRRTTKKPPPRRRVSPQPVRLTQPVRPVRLPQPVQPAPKFSPPPDVDFFLSELNVDTPKHIKLDPYQVHLNGLHNKMGTVNQVNLDEFRERILRQMNLNTKIYSPTVQASFQKMLDAYIRKLRESFTTTDEEKAFLQKYAVPDQPDVIDLNKVYDDMEQRSGVYEVLTDRITAKDVDVVIEQQYSKLLNKGNIISALCRHYYEVLRKVADVRDLLDYIKVGNKYYSVLYFYIQSLEVNNAQDKIKQFNDYLNKNFDTIDPFIIVARDVPTKEETFERDFEIKVDTTDAVLKAHISYIKSGTIISGEGPKFVPKEYTEFVKDITPITVFKELYKPGYRVYTDQPSILFGVFIPRDKALQSGFFGGETLTDEAEKIRKDYDIEVSDVKKFYTDVNSNIRQFGNQIRIDLAKLYVALKDTGKTDVIENMYDTLMRRMIEAGVIKLEDSKRIRINELKTGQKEEILSDIKSAIDDFKVRLGVYIYLLINRTDIDKAQREAKTLIDESETQSKKSLFKELRNADTDYAQILINFVSNVLSKVKKRINATWQDIVRNLPGASILAGIASTIQSVAVKLGMGAWNAAKAFVSSFSKIWDVIIGKPTVKDEYKIEDPNIISAIDMISRRLEDETIAVNQELGYTPEGNSWKSILYKIWNMIVGLIKWIYNMWVKWSSQIGVIISIIRIYMKRSCDDMLIEHGKIVDVYEDWWTTVKGAAAEVGKSSLSWQLFLTFVKNGGLSPNPSGSVADDAPNKKGGFDAFGMLSKFIGGIMPFGGVVEFVFDAVEKVYSWISDKIGLIADSVIIKQIRDYVDMDSFTFALSTGAQAYMTFRDLTEIFNFILFEDSKGCFGQEVYENRITIESTVGEKVGQVVTDVGRTGLSIVNLGLETTYDVGDLFRHAYRNVGYVIEDVYESLTAAHGSKHRFKVFRNRESQAIFQSIMIYNRYMGSLYQEMLKTAPGIGPEKEYEIVKIMKMFIDPDARQSISNLIGIHERLLDEYKNKYTKKGNAFDMILPNRYVYSPIPFDQYFSFSTTISGLIHACKTLPFFQKLKHTPLKALEELCGTNVELFKKMTEMDAGLFLVTSVELGMYNAMQAIKEERIRRELLLKDGGIFEQNPVAISVAGTLLFATATGLSNPIDTATLATGLPTRLSTIIKAAGIGLLSYGVFTKARQTVVSTTSGIMDVIQGQWGISSEKCNLFFGENASELTGCDTRAIPFIPFYELYHYGIMYLFGKNYLDIPIEQKAIQFKDNRHYRTVPKQTFMYIDFKPYDVLSTEQILKIKDLGKDAVEKLASLTGIRKPPYEIHKDMVKMLKTEVILHNFTVNEDVPLTNILMKYLNINESEALKIIQDLVNIYTEVHQTTWYNLWINTKTAPATYQNFLKTGITGDQRDQFIEFTTKHLYKILEDMFFPSMKDFDDMFLGAANTHLSHILDYIAELSMTYRRQDFGMIIPLQREDGKIVSIRDLDIYGEQGRDATKFEGFYKFMLDISYNEKLYSIEEEENRLLLIKKNNYFVDESTWSPLSLEESYVQYNRITVDTSMSIMQETLERYKFMSQIAPKVNALIVTREWNKQIEKRKASRARLMASISGKRALARTGAFDIDRYVKMLRENKEKPTLSEVSIDLDQWRQLIPEPYILSGVPFKTLTNYNIEESKWIEYILDDITLYRDNFNKLDSGLRTDMYYNTDKFLRSGLIRFEKGEVEGSRIREDGVVKVTESELNVVKYHDYFIRVLDPIYMMSRSITSTVFEYLNQQLNHENVSSVQQLFL